MDAQTSHATRSTPRRRERIDRDRWVSIRPIERTDAAGLSDFYAGLSPESRRRRFLGCTSLPDSALGRRFTDPEGEGFLAVLDEAGPNDGAIVAHASLQPDGPDSAEIAFAVADELQGRGLGRLLMKVVLADARRRGLNRLNATLYAENAPMRRLLRGGGVQILSDDIDAGVEEIAVAV